MERSTDSEKNALIPLEIPSANKRSEKFLTGLTLLELLAAMALLGVVLLTASSLLISFKKFYFDFMQRQTEIGEVSLGVLEEMAGRVKIANNVTITNGSEIAIRVDNTDPSIYTDDATYTYWLDGNAIKYREKINGDPESQPKEIAQHIGVLTFELQPTEAPAVNRVKITIGIIPSSGAQQNFETTVIARASAAEAP